MNNYKVELCSPDLVKDIIVNEHYAHKMPSVSFAAALIDDGKVIGAITFGQPASRHLQLGCCPQDPNLVIELNRLVVLDCAPKNTESWFISKALKLLPSLIVVSYADSLQGHFGYVYRAANFFYSGWTDMDRKTARLDYLVPGKHSRNAFRSGMGVSAEKVRRKPKAKYWIVCGSNSQKKKLRSMCAWPRISWSDYPPPSEHKKINLTRDGLCDASS